MAHQYYPPAASSTSDAPDLFLCLTTDRDGRVVREYVASDELADFLDPPRTLDADFRRELIGACEDLAKLKLATATPLSLADLLHDNFSISRADAIAVVTEYYNEYYDATPDADPTPALDEEDEEARRRAYENSNGLLTLREAIEKWNEEHPKKPLTVDDFDVEDLLDVRACHPITETRSHDSAAVEDFRDARETLPPDAPFDQIFTAARARVAQREEAARKAASATNSENNVPPGFMLTDKTLYVLREVKTKDGTEERKHEVCSHLEVVALTRDTNGGDWGRLLKFKDPDGREHEWAMPTELLAGEGSEYRGRLLEQGLTIWPSKEARYGLHEYIAQCSPSARVRAVPRVGWHGAAFVLPDATFGNSDGERTLYQSAVSINHAFNVRGTIEAWQREISARCVGNSRLIFAESIGFAAPLLHLLNDESGGFNFVGASSSGKTTALRVAGATWGGSDQPAGYLRQWRANANGLGGVAAMHCDGLLCLDEMGQVSAREAGEVGYLLANGQGKNRARRDGSSRSPFAWRLLFLSSGEITLADKIKEDGRQRSTAGQQVRILDIPAETGKFGLFENLHDAASGQEFADILRNATQQNYGAAIRAFLPEITKQAERKADAARKHRDDFLAQHLSAGASEQVGRAAARFGVVAAAGELATAIGITGWKAGSADEAAGICFEAWLARRGYSGPAEIEAGIEQVRKFFAQYGGSRFEDGTARVVINRAGFRKDNNFCVYPEVFKTEIAGGYDWHTLTDALATRGLLKRDKNQKTQYPVRDPGSGKLIRMFCFVPAILGEEVADDDEG